MFGRIAVINTFNGMFCEARSHKCCSFNPKIVQLLIKAYYSHRNHIVIYNQLFFHRNDSMDTNIKGGDI